MIYNITCEVVMDTLNHACCLWCSTRANLQEEVSKMAADARIRVMCHDPTRWINN